ncbi:glutaminase [Oceanicoccus sp. KOV_DT_Chl]|uniref:glutaminase n=1 Tax=Oceanicoccus sp. KOV_DT_Chl TaxID=1904639 RepID=UPI000C7DCF79|nr:glutaminase [Oceanicoccus sp. KOV_DT_Chl]
MKHLQQILSQACDSVRKEIAIGKTANYIPALARINPNKFGAAIVTVEGEIFRYGDATEPFSIQSISKVFALTLALNKLGDQLWLRVGREPSGSAFNSIVQLEKELGIPRNPLINAGALAVTDVLLEKSSSDNCVSEILSFIQTLANDDTVKIDAEVAQSELNTAHRNISLAEFMKSFNNIRCDVSEVVKAYCHHCAISMNCEQLARSFLFLANEGKDPVTGKQVVSPQRARRINSIMMLCGHYDASGDFAFRVGLPGKSGVGGGIVAVVPNVAAITVWSPCLNSNGNSHAGTAALEAITQATRWNIL